MTLQQILKKRNTQLAKKGITDTIIENTSPKSANKSKQS
jgi:hypothetical protein